jgi:hypothetical protein
VRDNGLLVTTDHSLADLTKLRNLDVGSNKIRISVGCEREDVTIDVYETGSINRAKLGQPADYPEIATRRDAFLKDKDVLFLQADTKGHKVPWLCAPGTISLKDFDGMPVTVAGIDNDQDQPLYVERLGQATSAWGAGQASTYLQMGPAAVRGMSGGPVVRRADGALVGIVHGNRISSNRGASENYFVPLLMFADKLRTFVDSCPTAETSLSDQAANQLFVEAAKLVSPAASLNERIAGIFQLETVASAKLRYYKTVVDMLKLIVKQHEPILRATASRTSRPTY